jgi:murein DD-endopeptidase MepM/ murein hydrolase activator NlpD
MPRLVIAALCALLFAVPAAAQDTALDDALAAALADYHALPNNPNRYREVWRAVEGGYAVIFVNVVDARTDTAYPGVIEWLYASRANGRWSIVRPGMVTYRTAYRALPETLKTAAAEADRVWRTPATPGLVDARDLADYELPFPHNATGTITRSYGTHGVGRIDIDLTAREVSAAKDGVIVFAEDRNAITTYESGGWWYWNAVIIRHGEHEYSLYGHLAQGSIPAWITDACPGRGIDRPCVVPVSAGDVIGWEGSTGNSTNPHLHFETGQGYGVIPYLDLLDGDNDGRRDQVIHAGMIWGEHNVGLNGTPPDEVAAWRYLTVVRSDLTGR